MRAKNIFDLYEEQHKDFKNPIADFSKKQSEQDPAEQDLAEQDPAEQDLAEQAEEPAESEE